MLRTAGGQACCHGFQTEDTGRKKEMGKNFILTILATTAAVSAIDMLIPVLPVYFLGISGNPAVMGLLIGITSFSAVLFRPAAHYFLSRTGMKRAVAGGALVFACVILCYPFYGSFVPIILLRISFGIAIVFFFVAAWSLIASMVPAEKRSVALSVYTVSFLSPNFYAPWIGSHLPGSTPYVISACLAAVSFLVCLFIREPETLCEDRHGFWKTLRHKDLFLPGLIMFSVIVADASVTVFLPVVAMRRNIAGYTLFFTFFSVSTIATRLYFGRICTAGNRHILLITGMVLTLLSFIAVGAAYALEAVAAAGALYGAGFGLIDPNLYTVIIEKRKDFSITQIMAGYGGFWDFGYAAGPLIMGVMLKNFGEHGLYAAAAASVFAGLAVSFIYMGRGENVELQKRCVVN